MSQFASIVSGVIIVYAPMILQAAEPLENAESLTLISAFVL